MDSINGVPLIDIEQATIAHLEACHEAQDDIEMESPAVDLFCGCETCVLRETLYAGFKAAGWDITKDEPDLSPAEALVQRIADEYPIYDDCGVNRCQFCGDSWDHHHDDCVWVLANKIKKHEPETSPTAELVSAVKAVLGTMNYYIGPGARTAVSRESVEKYDRIVEAVKRCEHG